MISIIIALIIQATYDAKVRLSDSLVNLRRVPHDILSLKSAALSFAEMAMGQHPTSTKALDMLSDANGMLSLAAELSPAHPEIAGLQAELLQMSGSRDAARQAIEKCAAHYAVSDMIDDATCDSTIDATCDATIVRASDGLSIAKLASLHLSFARAFMAIQDGQGALRQLDLSIKFNPNVPDVYQTVAAAHQLLGNKIEANSALSRANQLISALST